MKTKHLSALQGIFIKKDCPFPKYYITMKSQNYISFPIWETPLFSAICHQKKEIKQTLAFYKEVVEYLLQFQFCKARTILYASQEQV